jgi:hypothetical protein
MHRLVIEGEARNTWMNERYKYFSNVYGNMKFYETLPGYAELADIILPRESNCHGNKELQLSSRTLPQRILERLHQIVALLTT